MIVIKHYSKFVLFFIIVETKDNRKIENSNILNVPLEKLYTLFSQFASCEMSSIVSPFESDNQATVICCRGILPSFEKSDFCTVDRPRSPPSPFDRLVPVLASIPNPSLATIPEVKETMKEKENVKVTVKESAKETVKELSFEFDNTKFVLSCSTNDGNTTCQLTIYGINTESNKILSAIIFHLNSPTTTLGLNKMTESTQHFLLTEKQFRHICPILDLLRVRHTFGSDMFHLGL